MPVRVKGATLINTMAVMRELLPAQRYQALISGCPVETQHLLRRTLVAVEWIPADVWSPFLDQVFEQVTQRDEVKFRRILRTVCARDFTTVNRRLIEGTNARGIIAKAPQLYGTYFDAGTFTTRELASHDGVTQAQGELRDFDARSMIHVIALHAFLEQLLTLAGAQRLLVTRVRDGRRDGLVTCDYLMTFS